jgi:hypothetical protein
MTITRTYMIIKATAPRRRAGHGHGWRAALEAALSEARSRAAEGGALRPAEGGAPPPPEGRETSTAPPPPPEGRETGDG